MAAKMIVVCMVVLLAVCVFAVCFQKSNVDKAMGGDGDVVEDIKTSFDNANEALESSPIGEFIREVDALTE